MMEEVFDSCYEVADSDASLFIIHYPQDIAKMWPRLTKRWKFRQWITWAYPANFGHSSKGGQMRAGLYSGWSKGPQVQRRKVVSHTNPTDKRIRKLIHEEGG